MTHPTDTAPGGEGMPLPPDGGMFERALAESRAGNAARAEETLRELLRHHPVHAGAHNELGRILERRGDRVAARGHFLQAVTADLLHAEALFNLVRILWEDREFTEAVFWFQETVTAAERRAPRRNPSAAEREEVERSVPPVKANPSDTGAILGLVAACLKYGLHREGLFYLMNCANIAVCDVPARPPKQFDAPAVPAENDPFLKHIRPELRDRKSGMNIVFVADHDIAGQMSFLFRLVNAHTIHRARLITLRADFLSGDRDLVILDGKPEEYAEAVAVIREADLFHFGRFPVNFGDIRWENLLKSDNAVVQYFGSEIRTNPRRIYAWHERMGIRGISAADFTMWERSPLLYHIRPICDFSRVSPCAPVGDVIRVCHTPTSRHIKKTAPFLAVMERLKKRHPVAVELIEGRSNRDCLAVKARCQISYDQISVGSFGVSAIESLAAGHAVLVGMSNFGACCFPDAPVVFVTPETLEERLDFLLGHPPEIARIGALAREYALREYDPIRVLRQYLWVYDLVVNGHRLVRDPDEALLR
ncbi:MAG: tetratricopeptide repeat protein [Planctomycetota bacterium]